MVDMNHYMLILYYLVSILSVFLYVASVQYKNKKDILLVQVFASFCYLIVYIIKGAWSGVFVEVLEEMKSIIFMKYAKEDKKIPFVILIIFIFLLVLVSIIFFDGIFSLLPLFINIILFVSSYFKNPKYMRITMLICGALWGIYNISIGAYIIVIGNILEIVSASISLIRFKE